MKRLYVIMFTSMAAAVIISGCAEKNTGRETVVVTGGNDDNKVEADYEDEETLESEITVTELENLNISMHAYLDEIISGNENAVFPEAEQFADNVSNIMALGDFERDGILYTVPDNADDVENAVVVYYGEYAVSINKSDMTTEVIRLTTDEDNTEVSEDVLLSAENLYNIQYNYSNGTAPLIEIPYIMVEDVYNNYDALLAASDEYAPILIREYAETDIVYLDYTSGYSIKWDKNDNGVFVEETDIEEMTAYMEKEPR